MKRVTVLGAFPFTVLVEFDKPFGEGYAHGGSCKDNHGRWGTHEEFKIIKAKKKGGGK